MQLTIGLIMCAIGGGLVGYGTERRKGFISITGVVIAQVAIFVLTR